MKCTYFPIQNFEKMDPNISWSISILPVIIEILIIASFRSILSKSPEIPSFRPFFTDSIALREFLSASRCLELVITILFSVERFRSLEIAFFRSSIFVWFRAEIWSNSIFFDLINWFKL